MRSENDTDSPLPALGPFSTRSWEAACAELRLSPREAEISRGLLDGATEMMVAASLGVSHHTVHAHVRRLYRKLRVGNRAELSVAILSACARQRADATHISPSKAPPTRARPK